MITNPLLALERQGILIFTLVLGWTPDGQLP